MREGGRVGVWKEGGREEGSVEGGKVMKGTQVQVNGTAARLTFDLWCPDPRYGDGFEGGHKLIPSNLQREDRVRALLIQEGLREGGGREGGREGVRVRGKGKSLSLHSKCMYIVQCICSV